MAKKNHHLADFETENTGGVLGGFLAEEEHLDRRAMFRLGTWGAASVGAIVIAVLTNQSSLRLRRDEFAAADLSRQAQQIQSVARDSQNETRRLAAAIDTLNGDRDRMYSRLTTLEQGLDSVIGAIAKQRTVAAAPPATPVSTPAIASTSTPAPPAALAAHPVAEGAATTQAPNSHSATNSEPIIGPVATATAAMTGKQAPETKPHEQTNAKLAAVVPALVAAPVPDAVSALSNPPATTTSQPMGTAKPSDPAAPKLVEPEPAKTAATAAPAALSPTVQPAQATPKPPAPESAAAAAPASDKRSADKPVIEKTVANAPPAPPTQVAVNRTEFGVDVGGANSVGGLRALWRGLLKSRSNAPLAALQPIIVIKEGTNGLGMQLRLVAGPLNDAAAAAKICAHMVENDRPCMTTVFDGQRLAMKADEASGSTAAMAARALSEKEKSSESSETEKPVAEKSKSISGRHSWRHHYYPKRPVVEEPPKQPEPTTTSTLSTLFSHR